ncbi:hypothetical protein BOW51_11340 [Solemya velesiana gill symbiont]|uniref:Uncharacterized protein n=1 Tax=Solemya velesiana gill symbiont TaxID=1918948 RepID=A0A1T2KRS2_9GAMM|nr:hypothetical protein BOW51_11340 [Solemya velesiana gill symbiont]
MYLTQIGAHFSQWVEQIPVELYRLKPANRFKKLFRNSALTGPELYHMTSLFGGYAADNTADDSLLM